MTDLTTEDIKSIIELVKEKSWLDYLVLYAPSVIALSSIALTGYMFKNQNKKNINESLVRDDIARLYQAADHFFEFSDAAGSFISYKKYHYQRIARGYDIDEGFLEGLKLKSKVLADSFTNLHQATFMLSSLGFKELADKLEAHRERVVALRSKTFSIEEKLKNGRISTLQATKLEKEFESEQKKLTKEKEKYVQDIIDCKEELVSISKL
ncbi:MULTISPECIES: hypothetical protein [Vibrio]|uniref:hypothetical protein n=1 Tax=Vibrio TaxID=662 RepID=UPI0007EEC8A3|nr:MULTISPECIES: hypothetical protein [Vibrio]OBT07561.1 hypothetical protein A9265_14215 [Vibrio cyclitrophicus]RPF57282.1 hypothetical protein EDB61_105184 [Vibrio crassostreae]